MSAFCRMSCNFSNFRARVLTPNCLSFSLISPIVRLWMSGVLLALFSWHSGFGDSSSFRILLLVSFISLDQYSLFAFRYILCFLSCSLFTCNLLLTRRISLGASHLFDFVRWNVLTSSLFFSTPFNFNRKRMKQLVPYMCQINNYYRDYVNTTCYYNGTLSSELFYAIMPLHEVRDMVN